MIILSPVRPYPSKMAEIWTTVSCKPGKIRRVHRGCWGLWRRLSVVPLVEFSQCTRCEPDLGQIVPKLRSKVGRTPGSASCSKLLAGTMFLRRVVCARSLSILLYRHERPLWIIETGSGRGEDMEVVWLRTRCWMWERNRARLICDKLSANH